MDWRKNRVTVGAVVFLALLVVTVWAVNWRDREPASVTDLPVVELDEESIASIEVKRPSGEKVVLSKTDGEWRVVEPLEAEADENNVNTAINRLTDLRLVRVVATQPDNYARLQVDDANVVEVTVHGTDEVLATLGVGKYADGMTMVRLDDRVEVFGASGSLRYAFDRELKAWRNRRIVSEQVDDVTSIRFESPKGTFQLEREGDKWVASTGAKALGDFDPKKVAGLVSTVARLMASGFAPEEVSAARAGLSEPVAVVQLTLREGDPVVLDVGTAADEGNEVYVRRRGNETIYLVSEYLANRIQPDAKAFEKSDEPPPAVAPAAPPATGQPQLPPDVMRQIREQIEAQQRQQN